MGKKSGSSSSWLTAVKRAFRSLSKDSDKKSSRRKVDNHQQEAEEEDKKRERRRWLFRKQSKGAEIIPSPEVKESTNEAKAAEHKHAIAVAAATAAAAEAAVEIIRLRQPRNNNASTAASNSVKQHSAATVIQTAFRGYLARRALIALKGIVHLQALIRGQLVRKQANMTMKYMQALFRVQARVRDQRARLSQDNGRRSMFAESTNLWESKYLKDIRDRNSRSREGSYASDDWRDCPRNLQELEAILKARNEAALAHEKSLAFAFQQQNQIMESDRTPYERDIEELEQDSTKFLDQWMPSKPWDHNTGRASTDFKRESVKTLEIDSLKPINSSGNTINGRRSRAQSPIHRSQYTSPHHHRSSFHDVGTIQSPMTPSFASRTRPSQVRSASPRCLREDKSHSTANTPSLRMQRLNSTSTVPRYSASSNSNDGMVLPNYMAATESAKARVRSQSAPRQRPCTPDRERGGGYNSGSSSVKKRLSYPIPEPRCVNFGYGFVRDLRSPSFKSVQAGFVGMEEINSYYADSVVGGEISACSTTDLRRWLR